MTTIPTELAEAREARTNAWNEYYIIIEREHTYNKFHEALNKAGAADRACSDLYARWQKVGGTSDIASIVEAEQTAGELTDAAYGQANLSKGSTPEWWEGVAEIPL